MGPGISPETTVRKHHRSSAGGRWKYHRSWFNSVIFLKAPNYNFSTNFSTNNVFVTLWHTWWQTDGPDINRASRIRPSPLLWISCLSALMSVISCVFAHSHTSTHIYTHLHTHRHTYTYTHCLNPKRTKTLQTHHSVHPSFQSAIMDVT